ncbi:MAG: sigma 54-interacting transcriptional regulator, partial [Desulfosalsimonadaceae bacterium]
ELFGHTKGAFTGAAAKRLGKFELAQGGTFFLDEIGNLSVNIQAKLLRALQEREIIPIGDNYPVKIDVRVIIASNTNLEEGIKKGNFREDLYYRINVFSILLPTLQERKEDIPLLALHFLNQFNPIFGKKIKDISEECMKLLVDYSWPGNIRELQNVIQQAIIMAEDIMLPEHLPDFIAENKVDANLMPASLAGEGKNVFPTDFSLKNHIDQLSRDAERRIILEMLKKANWNKAETARLLKMNYKTLYLKIKEFNLHAPSQ